MDQLLVPWQEGSSMMSFDAETDSKPIIIITVSLRPASTTSQRYNLTNYIITERK